MAKRFTVTVEQEFIVYADCPEEAEPPVGGHTDALSNGTLPGKT